MNVMMKSPVTSTPASDARNSTVVSRGFSSCTSSCSFFFNRFPFGRLLDQQQSAVPSSDLQDVTHRVQEPLKFITGSELARRLLGLPHGPVNKKGAAHNVLPGN